MIKKPIPRSKIFNTRQPILRQMARRYTPTISISDRLDDISAILRRPTTGLLDITSNTQQAATDAHQAANNAHQAANNAFTQAQAAIDTANTAQTTTPTPPKPPHPTPNQQTPHTNQIKQDKNR